MLVCEICGSRDDPCKCGVGLNSISINSKAAVKVKGEIQNQIP